MPNNDEAIERLKTELYEVAEYRSTGDRSVPIEAVDALTNAAWDLIRAYERQGELLAKVERDRVELRDKRNDLLDIRGLLSPNGQPRRVPMELGDTVAPAVEWLLAENRRLTDRLAYAQDRPWQNQ